MLSALWGWLTCGMMKLTGMAIQAMMYGMCLSLKNEIVHIAPKGRVNVVAPGEWMDLQFYPSASSRPGGHG